MTGREQGRDCSIVEGLTATCAKAKDRLARMKEQSFICQILEASLVLSQSLDPQSSLSSRKGSERRRKEGKEYRIESEIFPFYIVYSF